MPSFNKEVQGNDFGFFKEEIGGGRHRVGGNHFWHQISCETLFAGLHPRMCQSMLICVTAYVHDSSIAKYAYEKRFDHVK